jgi:hypothetical protein
VVDHGLRISTNDGATEKSVEDHDIGLGSSGRVAATHGRRPVFRFCSISQTHNFERSKPLDYADVRIGLTDDALMDPSELCPFHRE